MLNRERDNNNHQNSYDEIGGLSSVRIGSDFLTTDYENASDIEADSDDSFNSDNYYARNPV